MLLTLSSVNKSDTARYRKIAAAVRVFSLGAAGYGAAECLYRGHTHWTMVILGGICFCMLYLINRALPCTALWVKCLLGSGVITLLEFVSGVLLNKLLHMRVWDYSDIPFNIMGQICPRFTFFWFMLCIPAYLLCTLIRKRI